MANFPDPQRAEEVLQHNKILDMGAQEVDPLETAMLRELAHQFPGVRPAVLAGMARAGIPPDTALGVARADATHQKATEAEAHYHDLIARGHPVITR